MLQNLLVFQKRREEALWKKRLGSSERVVASLGLDPFAISFDWNSYGGTISWRNYITKAARMKRKDIVNQKRRSKQILFFGPVIEESNAASRRANRKFKLDCKKEGHSHQSTKDDRRKSKSNNINLKDQRTRMKKTGHTVENTGQYSEAGFSASQYDVCIPRGFLYQQSNIGGLTVGAESATENRRIRKIKIDYKRKGFNNNSPIASHSKSLRIDGNLSKESSMQNKQIAATSNRVFRRDILVTKRLKKSEEMNDIAGHVNNHAGHFSAESSLGNNSSINAMSDLQNAHTTLSSDDSEPEANAVNEIITFDEEQETDYPNEAWNFGAPEHTCQYCGAILWYEERNQRTKKVVNPKFSICCLEGKVHLPFLKEVPAFLKGLLDLSKGKKSRIFRQNIRAYNSLFAFTSMGGKVDKLINKGKGPYVFRLNGQNHHLLGSLLPIDGESPRFAQLYIIDTENEIANRLSVVNGDNETSKIDQEIVNGLMAMLDEHNALAQSFRMARDRFSENIPEFRLRLISSREKDGRQYNMPSKAEVAALIVGDSDGEIGKRDIIVEHKMRGLKQISDLHPSFMAMQYPLLFPYGEDGYREEILHREESLKSTKVKHKVTMREYYAFRLQQRVNESHALLKSGRLLQQYMVDAYAQIEEQKLRWVKGNQDKLRLDLYRGLEDAVLRGDTDGISVGQRTVLPSSHTGSPRYKVQNYQDAMAICRWAGYPDLFITFTCNPKWPEIKYMLQILGEKNVEDRPDISTRVFEIKLHELMDDIRKKNIFGKTTAVLYTVEFQQRGLPHAHIVLFLHPDSKNPSVAHIDKIISAEIPDRKQDPIGYNAVKNFMIHGPCGKINSNASCMENHKCNKRYPKQYYEETMINEDGFPTYRRRRKTDTIRINGEDFDNRWVVPYNRNLIVKYQSHINVELCNHSRSIKYLFKYVNKGPDKAKAVIEPVNSGDNSSNPNSDVNNSSARSSIVSNKDEVKEYLDCRYLSACEACWRIFQFDINYRYPAVIRLSFHLEGEQGIIFKDSDKLKDVLDKPDVEKTMFTEWMATNNMYEDARALTYAEFPTKWVWHDKEKKWRRRQSRLSIGRIYYTHPNSGEKYYLRMLLNQVQGPISYQEIRTFNGTTYPTFKEACHARGLLGDDREWNECIDEASHWATGTQLRHLFVTILIHCGVSNNLQFWMANKRLISEGLEEQVRRDLDFNDFHLRDEHLDNYLLLELENILQRCGRSLKEFGGMPLPDQALVREMNNKLMAEQLNFDKNALRQEFENLHANLNDEQKKVYDSIIESVEQGQGKLFFINGHGGTGKTYLWRTLMAKLRSESKIVLAVASSGIAALLLPGGRTAHSRFHIPIDPTAKTVCNIKQGSPLAEVIKKASLIIWDEAPMMHKHCFESLHKSLQDLLRFNIPDSESKPFGGLTTVLGGDFRQILPVVPKGRREDTLRASIKSSYLWQDVVEMSLSYNMRLASSKDPKEQAELVEFAKWMLDVGEGKPNLFVKDDWIQLPNVLLLDNGKDSKKAIVENTFPNLEENFQDVMYLEERAILAPTNEAVKDINDYILDSIPGEVVIYHSSDCISKVSKGIRDEDVLYPTEFLNSLELPGLPNHQLRLKVGVPIMLIRNLDQILGLCNGTRLIVTKLGKWFIEAEIMIGLNKGQIVYIPRIELSSESSFPFTLERRQFPIKVCYAMTINKSQGQTLKNVGLYLPKQVFSHGQLYVAISRVTSNKSLKILVDDPHVEGHGMIKNVVYEEIFK